MRAENLRLEDFRQLIQLYLCPTRTVVCLIKLTHANSKVERPKLVRILGVR